jgi:hypothetical protein
MKRQLLCLLGVLSAVGLTAGCARAPDEQMVIERQVRLSPKLFGMTPYGVTRTDDGDFVVLGATGGGQDYRPWATRVSSSGEIRWDFVQGPPDGWHDHSVSSQRFYGAVELPDHTTLLCGFIRPGLRGTIVLDHLRADGTLIEERMIRANTGSSFTRMNCAPWGGGLALVGGIEGSPTGIGWLGRVDDQLQLQWEKFNPGYIYDDLVQAGNGELFVLSWSGGSCFVMSLGSSGEILARHSLPAGENHLVKPGEANRSGVSVVTTLPSSATELLEFDGQLHQSKSRSLGDLGVRTAVEAADGTVSIFGGELHGSATAAVTRVYKNGSYRTFSVPPLHQSPWYYDATPTAKAKEFAATRLVGTAATLDWIAFR